MSGIVVQHKETHIKYAISERNFNPDIHTKVRDLKPSESVQAFKPIKTVKLKQDEPADSPTETPNKK